MFEIGEYLAKLPARTWLSRAIWAPGQCTAKRRRKCTLTWFIDAEFGDAEFLSLGVQALNDDVLWELVGLRAVDGDHLSSRHWHGHRATDLVRARLHCRTRDRKAVHVSDLEVVQTIYCNNANRVSQCMYSNIEIADFNILIFWDLTARACISLVVDIARYSVLMSAYFE